MPIRDEDGRVDMMLVMSLFMDSYSELKHTSAFQPSRPSRLLRNSTMIFVDDLVRHLHAQGHLEYIVTYFTFTY